MTDLVQRLRSGRWLGETTGKQAADRIEQLEKALRQIVLMPECMDPAADMCEIAMKALGWEEIGDD